MEKQPEWAHKLGGAESLGISKLGQTVLSRLMEFQIWHQHVGYVPLWVEGLENVQWPLLFLMPDTSISPSKYATCAFQAATPLLELRRSLSR